MRLALQTVSQADGLLVLDKCFIAWHCYYGSWELTAWDVGTVLESGGRDG